MQNIAIFVEPRKHDKVIIVLEQFMKILKDWRFVFYCGKNLSKYWQEKIKVKIKVNINKNIIIRELEVNNLNSQEYSNLLKSYKFWNENSSNYVLIFQTDAWLNENSKFDINIFLEKEYSYIGSNVCYKWPHLNYISNLFKTKIYKNFNGGLSLRRHKDMMFIIENNKIKLNLLKLLEIPEDVFFVLNCYLLNLKIGDDEFCNNFSCHSVFVESSFGYHQPLKHILNRVIEDCPSIVNMIK
jgi:hypothetical protein